MNNRTDEQTNNRTFEQMNNRSDGWMLLGGKGHNLCIVGILICLCQLCICLVSSPSFAAVPPWEIDGLLNKEAPAFHFVDFSGKAISDVDLRGKVVLLNFWATWCSPCREEFPAFSKIYSQFKEKGLVILGVSIDSSPDLVKEFLQKKPVNFPVAWDRDSKIADTYKVYTYPTTFLIDRQGVIQEFFLGAQEWEDASFVDKLNKLLAVDGAICKGKNK